MKLISAIRADKKIVIILILSVIATFLLGRIIINVPEVVQVMSTGKTPVSIIMYHSILKDSKMAGEFVISPDQFEKDIKFLIDNGYNFITATELINFVKEKKYSLPDKPVMITFDDGYYNNFVYVYPIMEKYDIPFVLSIIGYYTDINKDGDKLSAYYSHVTWDQVREMSESGLVDIQNHSYNLHKISNARAGSAKNSNETVEQYRKFLSEDLTKLQELLKKKSGVKANTFTYPFGKISEESVDILKELGFSAALTCHNGINYIEKGDTEALYHLKRFNRPHGQSSENFFKGKLEGL